MAFVELRLRLRRARARQHAEFAQHAGERSMVRRFDRTVHEHRDFEAHEEHGKQGDEMGVARMQPIGRQDDGHAGRRRAPALHAFAQGPVEPAAHVGGLGAGGKRHPQGAEFEIRHAAIEHRAEQVERLVGVQVFNAIDAREPPQFAREGDHRPVPADSMPVEQH